MHAWQRRSLGNGALWATALSGQRRSLGAALTPIVLTLGLTPSAAAQQGEEAAIARAVEALNKAMVARDKAKLEALTVPQLSYGHSSGRIENRQQFVDNLMSGNSVLKFINLTEQTIDMVGNDAIVRHLFTAETENRSGQVMPVKIGVMQIWQKQDGDWTLLARQAYRL